jgi:hypothetical protein
MQEKRVFIDISDESADLSSLINHEAWNICGSFVSIHVAGASIAGYIVSAIGNKNKAVLINNRVVKSFDSNYVVGETIVWLADYDTIKL